MKVMVLIMLKLIGTLLLRNGSDNMTVILYL
jgi:hypothetical protein